MTSIWIIFAFFCRPSETLFRLAQACAERMVQTGGQQIQGNETPNFRDWGPRISERGGGGVGQAGQHKLSSLGQGPAISPGGQGSAVIILLVCCAQR